MATRIHVRVATTNCYNNLMNEVGGQTNKPEHWRSWLYIGIIIVAAAVVAIVVWAIARQIIENDLKVTENAPPQAQPKSTTAPELATETILNGRDHVWDLAFLPTGEMLFTERKGTINMLKDGQASELAKPSDVAVKGEGGMLGITVDKDFIKNRYIYTCLNSSQNGGDVRVARWQVKADLSGLENRNDIITSIPTNKNGQNGRHSGCRVAFGPDGNLWVGTGDAATENSSQDPNGLGGKVLRVDREGKGVAGNQGGGFDPRIYSYGHRNVQGIAFFAKASAGVLGVSVEHGSNVDDEVNLLTTGNFGWAPTIKGYNELGVPMTDKARFPNAVDAIWSSGKPTQAPSGVAVLKGKKWKAWEGGLAVAVLKDTHLKILLLDENNKVTKEEKLYKGQFGRLRASVLGPDGSLYLTTDNGTPDQIIRITPN